MLERGQLPKQVDTNLGQSPWSLIQRILTVPPNSNYFLSILLSDDNQFYIMSVKENIRLIRAGGGGYSPNMVNGGVPLKWVTFSQEIPKHGL